MYWLSICSFYIFTQDGMSESLGAEASSSVMWKARYPGQSYQACYRHSWQISSGPHSVTHWFTLCSQEATDWPWSFLPVWFEWGRWMDSEKDTIPLPVLVGLTVTKQRGNFWQHRSEGGGSHQSAITLTRCTIQLAWPIHLSMLTLCCNWCLHCSEAIWKRY